VSSAVVDAETVEVEVADDVSDDDGDVVAEDLGGA